MANLKFGNTNIGKISIIEPYESTYVETETPTQPYVRPAHFLDLPVINSGEHKCAILYAISSGNHPENIIYIHALGMQNPSNTSQYLSDYTINWGDGTSDTVNSLSSQDKTFYHEYDFNDLNQTTEFERNGLKFRQAIMVIEANSGIRNFNWLGYYVPPGATRDDAIIPILDMNLNLPSAEYVHPTDWGRGRKPYLKEATINIPYARGLNSYFKGAYELEQVNMYSGAMPNLTGVNQMFQYCGLNPEKYPKFDTSNVVSAHSFASYVDYDKYPSGLYDFPSIRNMSSFFGGSNFKEINIDIPSTVETGSYMFQACRKLETIKGNWDTSNIRDMTHAFNECRNLVTMPKIDFSSATNLYRTFRENWRNISLPRELNAQNCTSFVETFVGCWSLETIKWTPPPSFGRCDSMFSSCHNLKNVEINGSLNFTDDRYGLTHLFAYCYSLENAPYIEFSGVTRANNMFYLCRNLKNVPHYDTSGIWYLAGMFSECTSLEKVPKFNLTGSGDPTVNIGSMFNKCYNIKEYPNFDLSNVYYGDQAFNSLGSLQYDTDQELDIDLSSASISLYNNSRQFSNAFAYQNMKKIRTLTIGSGAWLNGTFQGCYNLESVPYADASLAYNLGALFNSCYNLKVGALSGTACDIGYNRCGLGSGAVVDVFNGFGTVSSATADMRYNPGMEYISQADLDIALNKGWTVLT